MECATCNASFADGSKFCERCGTALARPCAACGNENSAKASFCANCGARLATSSATSSTPAGETASKKSPTDSAERRQLTVMFCDMVGSSALSTRLDPEAQRDVVSAFQAACAAEIGRLDGMVAQYLGDGVLAYFGYPAAHEDDAERAVRAGIAILENMKTLQPTLNLTVQARVGIASGVVVVGDLVRGGMTQENAAIGETTNLAARLQGLADSDTVVISDDTYKLVGKLFRYRDLGDHNVKGFPQPVRVRRVLGLGGIESRFEARRRSADVGPLIGRDEEFELLARRWQQVAQGAGRVVLITGEAGIGKSRLTLALQDLVTSESTTQLTYHCSPYHQDSSLHPIIGHLLRAAGIERDDSANAKLDKLAALLGQTSEQLEEDLPLFAALLAIPGGDRCPLPKLTPSQLKERMLSALVDHLRRLCSRRPVLVLFEDLHWIDPTSLELLSRIIDQAPEMRCLLLATARPEFASPWPSHRHISTIGLTRFDRTEAENLITALTGGRQMPSEVLVQLLDRTDGVPLFIEELTKTVVESGLLREDDNRYELTGPLSPLAIPSTLHASLLARLDRVAAVKNVAQIGATIGREFSYALVAASAGMPDHEVQAGLQQLVDSGLVFRRGVPPDAKYRFKHALVQDAAYDSLVRSRRQHLHSSIARALEERFPEIVAREPEVLANHFTQAAAAEPAIEYWRKGGELALRRSAIAEAVSHFTKGIELIKKLPPSADRDRKELDLLLPLAPAMSAMKGFAAPETIIVMSRARELLGNSGTLVEQMSVLTGLYFVHFMHGPDFHKALDVAQQCLTLATNHKHAEATAQAHRFIGQALWYRGEFTESRRHLEQCISLAGDARPSELRFSLSSNGLGALCFLSLGLQVLGSFEESAAAIAHALNHASDPLTKAQAMIGDILRVVLGADPAQARVSADDLLAYSLDHRLAYFEQWARFHQGHRLIEKGDPGRRIEMMTKSIEAARKIGCDLFAPMHLALLSTVQADSGDLHGALASLTEAIERAARSLERYFEPELHRLRGELLLRLGNSDGERSLLRALTLARAQQARVWEVRAATSLAQHWIPAGKRADARDLLAPAVGQLTHGRQEFLDLKRARTVLATLTEAPAS